MGEPVQAEDPLAFATIEDLSKRWRPLQPSEEERAKTLLQDAAVFLQAEFKRAGVKIDPEDKLQASALKMVSCSIVRRIMASNLDGNYSQVSRTAGSFNEQYTIANPSGDMYLTAREYAVLGISNGGSKIGQIGPKLAGDDDDG